jgi:hypothetical protein
LKDIGVLCRIISICYGGTEMKKNNIKLNIVTLSGVLIVIIIILLIRFPVKTVQAVYSTYEDKINFKGFYFVNEYVVYSEDTKGIKLNYKDGDLVSKDTKISDNITAREAGMVINHIDGFENKYNRSNIKNIKIEDINNMLSSKRRPGVKILDNSVWYICGYIDPNMSKYISKGTARDISINNKYYAADIIDVFKNDSGTFVLMRLKNDLDAESLNRGIKGDIIRNRYNAIVIPENSIIEYNGDMGVFVKLNNYAEFKKIKILTKGNGKAVVIPAEKSKPELMEYDDVICNPRGLKNGKKL